MTDFEHRRDDEVGRELRRRAEKHLQLTRTDVAAMSVSDVQDLVYELQVHQIELEMQNEALSQAQAESETARQRYQELYDFAPVGYLTLTTDDVIVEANLMAAKLLGAAREELIGRIFTDFVRPESRAVHFLHKRGVFRTHERQDCQLELVGDGPLHVYVNSHAEVGADRCRTVLSDITAIKKLEVKLMDLAETAQAASKAKSQFLANMSHEIRTPLNAVIGLSSVLDMTPLDEEQARFVSTIRTCAESLLGLINDLLDYSKLESGAVQLEHQPFDLSHLLASVQRICSVAANEKGLPLILEYDKALPKVFGGDAFRLRQIVLNLVSNAVKFTEKGSVIIRVNGTPAVEDGHTDLVVRVIDTGIGIPAQMRDAVFDSFTQADASMTRRYGGTGLGLAIAKRLAHSMNGDIDISANEPKGSVFCLKITLPTASFPVEHLAPEAFPVPEQAPAHRPRILLVEDQPANIMVATAYLERFGCDVDVCHNGQEAVERFEGDRYAMVLMDVEMPEMDGFTAAQKMREVEASAGLKPTPIIAMTAHVLPEERQKCKDSGMDDYMSKPFDPADLQRRISALSDG